MTEAVTANRLPSGWHWLDHGGLLLHDTPDGPEFIRCCRTHGWASLPFYTLRDDLTGSRCLKCMAALEAGHGEARYVELCAIIGAW